MRYSAAFLDRDGTVIREGPYLSDPAAVELLPNAGSAIALLNEREIPVVIVTNQSGIGRGLYTTAAFRAVQAEMEAQLGAETIFSGETEAGVRAFQDGKGRRGKFG